MRSLSLSLSLCDMGKRETETEKKVHTKHETQNIHTSMPGKPGENTQSNMFYVGI